ncbi:putative cyclase [Mycobacterium saskatchewanense]|nr:putative cyclase [Mycobacterium saskatchewanense]
MAVNDVAAHPPLPDKPAEWGADDEAGAANFVGPQAVRRGIRCVRSGTTLSLAAPIRNGKGFGLVGRAAPMHYMTRSGADYAAGQPERGGFGFADDVITMPTHGVTHVDALAHVWSDGVLYNGFSSREITSRGARRLGIEKMPPLVTRGVVVDAAGERMRNSHKPIGVDELATLVDETGTTLEAGDALLVRTGWLTSALAGRTDATTWPGLDNSCGPWLAEQRVALVGADNPGVEVFPSSDPACQVPLHLQLVRGHGVYFSELMALDRLCEAAQSEFLFVLAPLPLVGGVGSPVAPVAVL